MPVSGIQVAAENAAQLEGWNGAEGEHWAAHAEFYDYCVHQHHGQFMAAAAIEQDQRVLDLACGNGLATRDAARAAQAGSAFGIDLSLQMVERARALASEERLDNVTFHQGDAQVYDFEQAAYDVAISRFGAMFFGDQAASFDNIRRALRPGGRLVVLSWQEPRNNEWITSIAGALTLGRPLPLPPAGTPGPFGHADQAATTSVLQKVGFRDIDCRPVVAPMYFGRSVDEGFLRISESMSWMMSGLTPDEQERAVADLRALLTAHSTPEGVAFGSAAWLFSARSR
jgi:SAM-dependent methyltransferase